MKNFYFPFYNLSALKSLGQSVAGFAALTMLALPAKLFGQAPTLSYSSPQIYTTHLAITPLAPVATGVDAPTGTYSSPIVLGSGLTVSQNGLAVDAAGNIYVNDQDAGSGDVKKIAADGSSTTIIASGFATQSAHVAVDQAGNVYIADQASVWKIPASGSPVTYGAPVVIGSFSRPFGIAADAAGNIYVTDLTVGGVYKMGNDGSNKTRIDNGISNPSGVAVDASGNAYAVDYVTNVLYEIPADGSPQVQLASGFTFARGVAVDGAGNIYVDDEGAGKGIFLVPPGGGPAVAAGPAFDSAVGVAVDAGYNLYVANQNFGYVSKLMQTGGYFISPALPNGLSLDAVTGIISGTPTKAGAAADYLVSAYNSTGGVSATVNITVNMPSPPAISYTSPQVYTAGTAISVLSPTTTGVGALAYDDDIVSVGPVFNAPNGVAIDAAGNIYVADGAAQTVTELPVGGGSPITIGSGFINPVAVAVDAAGNVYVADEGDAAVKKVLKSDNSIVSIGSGFTAPTGVAVDGDGNVYVTDNTIPGDNAVYEIAGCGCTEELGGGFEALTGIAANAKGDIYFTDGGAGQAFKVRSGGYPVNIGCSFNYPSGVAVNASGDVYIADQGDNKVYLIPAGTHTQKSIGSGFNGPEGLAADGAGNVYVADTYSHKINKIAPAGGYFISRSLPKGLRFNGGTGTISGTPGIVSAATDYTVTGYNYGGGTPAIVNITVNLPPPPVISYAGPQLYLQNTAITPLAPTVTGAAASGYGGTATVVASGFETPVGVAVDAAGNIFVADQDANLVSKISGGGAPISIGGSALNGPSGVAVDAAGNVYIADSGNSAVEKMTGGTGAPVPIGGSAIFVYPTGLATDAKGNVFIADQGKPRLFEIHGGGTGNAYGIRVGASFFDPTAVAVDAAGNFYVADASSGVAYKIPAGGGTAVQIGSGFIAPTGIAVDAAGNVFVADPLVGTVTELPADGSPGVTITAFIAPWAIAVDGAGNLFVGDIGDGTVKQLKPSGGYFINASLPTGLSFDSVTGIISGTPTAASLSKNYTVTAYNLGGGTQAIVNIGVATNNANLASLWVNHYLTSSVSPTFDPAITDYTLSVGNDISSVAITPRTSDTGARVTVNGTAVTSRTASDAIALDVGSNIITTIVTAQDGITTKTYTLTVTRAISTNADLAHAGINHLLTSSISPAFDRSVTGYTVAATSDISSVTITPRPADPTATVTVNGTPVVSKTASDPIILNTGDNTITVVVTAQDGITTKTYTFVVTRAVSANANLAYMGITHSVPGSLLPSFDPAVTSYTLPVDNDVTALNVIPRPADPAATVTVNGEGVVSKTASSPIALNVGDNTLTTIVTAPDGTTTKTYTVTVTRAVAPFNALYVPVGVAKPTESLQYAEDGITVHQGISPNGDGQNDVLTIDGISNYPDNKLSIMNRSGQLVYEAKGYDNTSKVFDGRSNKTGVKQLPGTYFYSLEYTAKGVAKRKTGFIVLKW